MNSEPHRTKSRLIDALYAECMRIRRNGEAHISQEPTDRQKALVAQGVLSTCMQAVTTDAMPFGTAFPIELAVRLASYGISLLPADQQDAGIREVLEQLPEAHRRRMAQGVCIKAEWGTRS
ncbi:hypothetical protein GCM10011380_08580 [Sphingomonas metalli]|uniref:Uncharacterized protein n=1 Tax=Sphingomonas metalli TaxID=1779358 RepID=A0A916WQY4_9SPHN|nr:hypothetical protein [Sphingomonas metalli]GGB21299.1 hypothetical protein GCM10011380_08580 [Sphingomonas metalli]